MEPTPINYNKLLEVFKSRKFWALVMSVVAVAGAFGTGEVTVWQAAQGIIAALAVYSTGVAISDIKYSR